LELGHHLGRRGRFFVKKTCAGLETGLEIGHYFRYNRHDVWQVISDLAKQAESFTAPRNSTPILRLSGSVPLQVCHVPVL
jgi:hypothetical protein